MKKKKMCVYGIPCEANVEYYVGLQKIEMIEQTKFLILIASGCFSLKKITFNEALNKNRKTLSKNMSS